MLFICLKTFDENMVCDALISTKVTSKSSEVGEIESNRIGSNEIESEAPLPPTRDT